LGDRETINVRALPEEDEIEPQDEAVERHASAVSDTS